MNSFIKNNKQFFSLVLGVLLHSSLYSMIIDNKPLNSIANFKELLIITFPEEDNAVVLEMEKGNFDEKWDKIDIIGNLKEVFQGAKQNRSGAIISRTCNIISNTINNNSSYFVGQENINIQAKTSAQFTRCLFESPVISIKSNDINFHDCFLINPHVLNIIGDFPESNYNTIQIIFNKEPKNPTIITGKIDFKDNQTTQKLILSNVKEIKLQFNPKAWNK